MWDDIMKFGWISGVIIGVLLLAAIYMAYKLYKQWKE